MKKRFLFFFLIAGLVQMNSCQKEVSFENSGNLSAGSLQTDITGECLPKTVAGSYVEGIVLNGDSSYIEVQVNVTQAGSYSINTDTVNGIYFRNSGAYNTTGLNTVRLKGNGTPLVAGIHNFIVTFDSTECAIAVTTLAAGGGGAAVFILDGFPGTCLSFIVAGSYVVTTPLTPANTVTINVNVTVIGTYTISTAVLNGMTFTGTGTFTATGPQTVVLAGNGTPITAGTTTIPITAGGSTCSFACDVLPVPSVSDYFPSTANSNWSYEFDDDPNDSLYIRVTSATTTISGNVYNIFEWTDTAAAGFDEYGKFRKSGGNYFSYADMGAYFGFDNSINMEYIFLKDDVPVNTSWLTATINGTSSGSAIPIRIVFTIGEKDVTVTVGSTPYDSTIVITEKYEVFNGTSWIDVTDLIGYFKIYYARNIGMIKQDYFYEDGNPDPPLSNKQDIRRYQVF